MRASAPRELVELLVLERAVADGAEDLAEVVVGARVDRDADARIVQARRVADLVATEGESHRVVAGDLNDEGEPEVVRELHRVGLRDVDGGSTNPAIAPRQRLDHVVIPAGAVVVEQHEPAGGEEWAELSDHLPVLVAFRLP